MAAHQYWRVLVMSNDHPTIRRTSIFELEMALAPDGANQCTGGTPIASSQVDTNHAITRAFDGVKIGDQWPWAPLASDELQPWIGYMFSSPVDIKQVRITSRSSVFYQSPKDFFVQYSDDGVTWEVSDVYTNITGWTANEERAFLVTGIPPTAEYKHVRVAPPCIINDNAKTKLSSELNINDKLFDRYWGGDGQLWGQVFEKRIPKLARIDVYESESKQFVRSEMTNTVGEFMIANINKSFKYDLIAVDPDGVWEHKVSSARTPI